jgi:hypothetical protein
MNVSVPNYDPDPAWDVNSPVWGSSSSGMLIAAAVAAALLFLSLRK